MSSDRSNLAVAECPHCGQRVLTRHGVELSPKLADIFDSVWVAGSGGLSKEELATMYFGSSNRTDGKRAAAVAISNINERFEWMESPIRIRSMGYGEPYRVEGIR